MRMRMWEKLDHSCISGRNINSTATLENTWPFLTKLGMCSSYSPAIELLGIYPKAMETDFYTKPYT